jgi:hypothetical protein
MQTFLLSLEELNPSYGSCHKNYDANPNGVLNSFAVAKPTSMMGIIAAAQQPRSRT